MWAFTDELPWMMDDRQKRKNIDREIHPLKMIFNPHFLNSCVCLEKLREECQTWKITGYFTLTAQIMHLCSTILSQLWVKYEESWCVVLWCCLMIKHSTFAEKCCDIEMIIAWDRSGVPRSAKMPHSLENTDSKYVAAAAFNRCHSV